MTKFETLADLQQRLAVVLDTVERELVPLSVEQLRWKPAPDRWSIIECLQHLNLAERYYIRNLQHKADLPRPAGLPADQALQSDWVGRLMRYIVDPQTRMRFPAPGLIRPRRAADLDVVSVMASFLGLQRLLQGLLERLVWLDWNREKVMSLFGNWLTIRLGDTLLMLVAHTERHLAQAMRVKAEMATFAPL